MHACMQGLEEMRAFSKALYPSVRDDTFLQACGIGDLIATCYGGRNRLVAQEWTKRAVVRVVRGRGARGGVHTNRLHTNRRQPADPCVPGAGMHAPY